MVKLVVNSVSSDGKTLSVTGPPSNRIFPPGAGWIYVLANGVPSVAKRFVGAKSEPLLTLQRDHRHRRGASIRQGRLRERASPSPRAG